MYRTKNIVEQSDMTLLKNYVFTEVHRNSGNKKKYIDLSEKYSKFRAFSATCLLNELYHIYQYDKIKYSMFKAYIHISFVCISEL